METQEDPVQEQAPQPPGEDSPPNSTAERPKPNARDVSWENIPPWQEHYWQRTNRDVVTKLPPPPKPLSDAPQSPIHEILADSDGESSSESDEDIDDPLSGKGTSEKPKAPRFPKDPQVNARICLWMGDPTILNVDAVVNPTPITSSDKKGLGARILVVAGPELAKYLRSLDRPKTGEVRETPGYNIAAPIILHTIGPRYSDQYITAAENALHNCYRSAFDYAIEHRLHAIAIPPIHSLHRQFPTLLGAHIALRTLRSLMDVRPKTLRRVVLCFDPRDDENLDTYHTLMKIYFPRTEEEEAMAIKLMPDFNANEFGETIMEERQVRIHASFGDETKSTFGGPASHPSTSAWGTAASSSSEPAQHGDPLFKRDENTFPASMMSMSAYKDDERRIKTAGGSRSSQPGQIDLYTQHLALANTTDLSSVSQLGMFYQAGVDRQGRPVIVIVGCRVPDDLKLLDLVFLHYIKFMDTFADSPYVLLYIHTHVSSKKKPSVAWFRKVYNLTDSKYSRSLVALHVLHPTFWLKVVEKLVSVFMDAEAIISKIAYYDRLVDMCDQLRFVPRLPNDILQYDASINGPLPPPEEPTS